MSKASEVIDRILELDGKCTDGPWQYRNGTPCGVHQPEFECWIPQDRDDAELIAYYRTAAVQCARALRVAMEQFQRIASESKYKYTAEQMQFVAREALQEINNIFNGTDAGNEGSDELFYNFSFERKRDGHAKGNISRGEG